MNYANEIGSYNILNTPPGGETTCRVWSQLSQIHESSVLLDLACSTGFSGRIISQLSGCQTYGIDISFNSLVSADKNFGSASYIQSAAEFLPFQDSVFSHIVAGCCFGFFSAPNKALLECNRVLHHQGYLLVSPFYYVAPPPNNLLDDVAGIIGYRPCPSRTLEYWRSFFTTHFKMIYDIDLLEPIVTLDDINLYAKDKLDHYRLSEAQIKSFVRSRAVLSRHREYQGVKIMILRRLNNG